LELELEVKDQEKRKKREVVDLDNKEEEDWMKEAEEESQKGMSSSLMSSWYSTDSPAY